jgi:arylsulfatase A-like enzyme
VSPDVLVLVVDSLRADRVSGGGRTCRTPFLDELRSEATTFASAFSVASMTTVCTASILTGSYPFVHGVHSLAGRRLRGDLPTLAEAFRHAGYHTWAEMTGPLEPVTGLDRGFDEYRYRPYSEWLDTPFGDRLLSRLREGPKPWLGYVHLWETHYPRRVTRPFNRSRYGELLYDRSVSSLDHQLGRLLEAVGPEAIVVVTSDHGEYLPREKREEWVTRLKRPAAWAKEHLPGARRLRRRLVPLLFGGGRSATPAEAARWQAWLGHGFHVYDPLVHVPLVIRAPGALPAGAEVSSLVSQVDLLPTLLALAGLDGGRAQPGALDLGRLARNGAAAERSGIYLQASGARRMSRPEQWLAALRTDRYKYVRGMYSEEIPEELYDLEQDPAETANLAAGRPDLAADLRGRLSDLMAADAPPEPAPETAYTPEEQERLEARLRDLGYFD